MKKLLIDTLQTNGKWSRKSLTTVVTFVFVLFLATFIVVSDKILARTVNQYAIIVFQSLLVFLATLMGLTEISKKFENKQEPTKEE